MVSQLLTCTKLDVNKPDSEGFTPYYVACENGQKEVVSLLLADPRIDINKPENDQCTPLWVASQEGHLAVVQLILTSGREVDTQTESIAGDEDWNSKTAAEVARFQETRVISEDEEEEDHARKQQNGPLIAALLDSFDLDPVTTRQKLRELPEVRDSHIQDLFSLVIFLCDGLLMVGPSASASSTNQRAVQFLQIAQRLPMELQMMLCNRMFGSAKDIVLTRDSELAFKRLVKRLAKSDAAGY